MTKDMAFSMLLLLTFIGFYQCMPTSLLDNDVHVCQHYDAAACQQNGHCNVTMKVCDKPGQGKRSHCYTLWTNESGEVTVAKQSCWLDHFQCYKPRCVATSPAQHLFCCCEGNMCNVNFAYEPVAKPTLLQTTTEAVILVNEDFFMTVAYSLLPIMAIAILVAFTFWLVRRYGGCQCDESSSDQSSLTEALMSPEKAAVDLITPPELTGEVIARGRFGTVQVARMDGEEVAVKMLQSGHKDSWQAWQRERDTYRLPGLASHPHILHFIAALQHNDQLWLVTQLHRHGCLTDYLKANVITWQELLTISCTMVEGLAFLHETTQVSDGQYKPVIAHRDIKSKNILLKMDGTACIGDFGLALPLCPGRLLNHPIQVGTRRYMSPEVLELTMSFDLNSFLHIDMYACALVLWELMSRCSVNGESVSEYMLPYEEEVGTNPTVAALADVVCRQGRRPAIDPKWSLTEELRLLSTILNELWDSDPEARLSACCVLERLRELSPADCLTIDTTRLEPGDGGRRGSHARNAMTGVGQEHTADSGVQSGEDHTGSASTSGSGQSTEHTLVRC